MQEKKIFRYQVVINIMKKDKKGWKEKEFMKQVLLGLPYFQDKA